MSCKDCKFSKELITNNLYCLLHPEHLLVQRDHFCYQFSSRIFSTELDMYKFSEGYYDLLRENAIEEQKLFNEIKILKKKLEELEQKSLKPAE